MRLNVEDSIYKDPRFIKLTIKIGCQWKAVGIMVSLWTLAQKYWIPDQQLIPYQTFEDNELPDMIFECKLAEKREHGVYVRGTKDNFQWYFDGIEQRRTAGKRSAESRKKKYGTAIPINAPYNNPCKTSNENRTAVERKSNEIEPSSSYSSSYSSSFSNSPSESTSYCFKEISKNEIKESTEVRGLQIHNKTSNENRTAVERKKATISTERNRKIWDAYLNAYRKRYGVDPVRNAMVNKQVSNLGDRLGLDEAIQVIDFYLLHNNSYYLKNTHSIGLCLKDAESLRTQMLKNHAITNLDLRQAEKINNYNAMNEIIDQMYPITGKGNVS